MATAIVTLGKVTVTGTSTTYVNFTSIPQTYKDLLLVYSGYPSTTGSTDIIINGVGNYAAANGWWGGGNTSSTYTSSQSGALYPYRGNQASYLNNAYINVYNYASTSDYKTLTWQSGNRYNETTMSVSNYLSTTGISQFGLQLSSGYFVANSTFVLYGIKA